jgi:hypothetical protein
MLNQAIVISLPAGLWIGSVSVAGVALLMIWGPPVILGSSPSAEYDVDGTAEIMSAAMASITSATEKLSLLFMFSSFELAAQIVIHSTWLRLLL